VVAGAVSEAKRSSSFLQKRTKKLFPGASRAKRPPRSAFKSFLLLFCKQEALAYAFVS
jgi:hypothetical protein